MTTSNEPVPRGTTYAVRRATTNDEPPRTLYLLVEYENAGADDQECHLVSTYESWGDAVRQAVALRRRRTPFAEHYGQPSPEQTAKFLSLLADTLPAGFQLPPYGYQCLAPLLALARAYLLATAADQDEGRSAKRALEILNALTAEALELAQDSMVFHYVPSRDGDD